MHAENAIHVLSEKIDDALYEILKKKRLIFLFFYFSIQSIYFLILIKYDSSS